MKRPPEEQQREHLKFANSWTHRLFAHLARHSSKPPFEPRAAKARSRHRHARLGIVIHVAGLRPPPFGTGSSTAAGFELGDLVVKDYLPVMIFASARDHHPMSRTSPAGAPAFLWVIVGILTAIEVVLSLSGSGVLGSADLRWPAFALGAFWQPVLSGTVPPAYPGQTVLMFISHAFLHGGFMHLALNCVVLLALGKFVATHVGAARTMLVLFLSAVGGAACFGLISSSSAPMIGASGAVFGLFGLWQAMDYRMRRRSGLPLQPVVMAFLALVASNILLLVMLSGGLAWEAHLGGWIVGWLSGQSFARR